LKLQKKASYSQEAYKGVFLRSDRQFFTPFLTAASQNVPPVSGFHPLSKTVRSFSLNIGLVG